MEYKNEWRAVNYSEGDEKEIIKLMQKDIKLRGSQAIFDEDYWYWKYKKNYDNFYDDEIFLVKNKKMKIIGHSALIPFSLSSKNDNVSSAQLVDILVKSDYRGKGFFSSMIKRYDKFQENHNVPILICFPNERSYPILIKNGWLNIFKVEELVYILNPSKVAKTKLSNPLARLLGQIFLLIKNKIYNYNHKKYEKNSYNVNMLKDFKLNNNIIEDWLNKRYLFYIDRCPDYLTWRYLQNPIDRCVITKLFSKRKKIKGIYLIKIKKYPHHNDLLIGHIMELLSDPEDIETINYMLFDIVKSCKEKNVDIIHVYSHVEQHDNNFIKKFGFMKFDEKSFIIRINKNEKLYKGIKDARNWYISLGDSDRA